MARNKLCTEGIQKLEMHYGTFIDIHTLNQANIREIEVYSQIMLFFTVRQVPTCFFLRKMTDIHKNGCFYGLAAVIQVYNQVHFIKFLSV